MRSLDPMSPAGKVKRCFAEFWSAAVEVYLVRMVAVLCLLVFLSKEKGRFGRHALLAGVIACASFAASAAQAGECPADQTKTDVRQPVDLKPVGVTDTVIAKIDVDRNLLYVKGSVPGNNGGIVRVTDARKKKPAAPLPYPTFIPVDGETLPAEMLAPHGDVDPYHYDEN